MMRQDLSVEHDDVIERAPDGGSVPEPELATEQGAVPLLLPLEIDDAGLARGIEAILFVVDEPVSAAVLSETLGVALDRVHAALGLLADRYRDEQRGIELLEVAGGWRLMTRPVAREVLERWTGNADGTATERTVAMLRDVMAAAGPRSGGSGQVPDR